LKEIVIGENVENIFATSNYQEVAKLVSIIALNVKEKSMADLRKRPDLTSMELQKYVGENWKKVKELIEKTGLSVFCAEERGGKEATISIARNVDIRYDRSNNEVIRIWRAG
jgi:hypothetical protein